MIDRQMQKTETFTGIDGINQQDRAVQESMGRIVDRTRENLGPADRAVVATRKLLLEAIDTVAARRRSARDRIKLLRAARRRGGAARGCRLAARALPMMYPQTGGSAPAAGPDRARQARKVLAEAAPLGSPRT